ncbi:MAG TPA: DUF3127 domain-containing protein [Chitinophagaceae bacterium]|nr:DUF3127 domain-containing protein [Chitinophagaceae bacterium]
MALEVIGEMHIIHDTQQITDTFAKREFVLKMTDHASTGMTYTNFATFQVVNNNCSLLDNFSVGDAVKVSFNLRGNAWEKDGVTRYITNLNAWRIERAHATQDQQQHTQSQAPTPPPPSKGNPTPFGSDPFGSEDSNPAKDSGDDLPF